MRAPSGENAAAETAPHGRAGPAAPPRSPRSTLALCVSIGPAHDPRAIGRERRRIDRTSSWPCRTSSSLSGQRGIHQRLPGLGDERPWFLDVGDRHAAQCQQHAVDRVAGSGLALGQRRQRSRFLRERLACVGLACASASLRRFRCCSPQLAPSSCCAQRLLCSAIRCCSPGDRCAGRLRPCCIQRTIEVGRVEESLNAVGPCALAAERLSLPALLALAPFRWSVRSIVLDGAFDVLRGCRRSTNVAVACKKLAAFLERSPTLAGADRRAFSSSLPVLHLGTDALARSEDFAVGVDPTPQRAPVADQCLMADLGQTLAAALVPARNQQAGRGVAELAHDLGHRRLIGNGRACARVLLTFSRRHQAHEQAARRLSAGSRPASRRSARRACRWRRLPGLSRCMRRSSGAPSVPPFCQALREASQVSRSAYSSSGSLPSSSPTSSRMLSTRLPSNPRPIGRRRAFDTFLELRRVSSVRG